MAGDRRLNRTGEDARASIGVVRYATDFAKSLLSRSVL